jgi:hypothetical protein
VSIPQHDHLEQDMKDLLREKEDEDARKLRETCGARYKNGARVLNFGQVRLSLVALFLCLTDSAVVIAYLSQFGCPVSYCVYYCLIVDLSL